MYKNNYAVYISSAIDPMIPKIPEESIPYFCLAGFLTNPESDLPIFKKDSGMKKLSSLWVLQ